VAAGKAYAADPYRIDANKTVWRLFQASLDTEQDLQAKHWCDEGARRFPNDYRFTECRLWLLTARNQTPPPSADAIWKAYDAYLAAAKVAKPAYAGGYGMMLAAIGLVRANLRDSARSVIRRAERSASVDPAGDIIYLEAIARTQLGEKGKAISLLSGFYAAHPQQRTFANRDDSFWWEPLRGDPRYQALVAPVK
jgi:hypothetical protein